jgi:hypothetical protein
MKQEPAVHTASFNARAGRTEEIVAHLVTILQRSGRFQVICVAGPEQPPDTGCPQALRDKRVRERDNPLS